MQLTKAWLAQLPLPNITNVYPVSGGDINAAFSFESQQQRYFLKVQPQRGAAFFDHEVDGLKKLGAVVKTPKVIAQGTIEKDGYLSSKLADGRSRIASRFRTCSRCGPSTNHAKIWLG
ncbi:hypothetical protein MH1LPH_14790 [Lactiplantibacillus brownii]